MAAMALGLLVATPSFAHHGTAGYDPAKTVVLTGTATEFVWANPHVIVYLDVKDEDGKVRNWSLELAAPLLMGRFGWKKDSIKPGDQVVAEAHPAKNGAAVGISATATFLLKFVVNGTPLPQH